MSTNSFFTNKTSYGVNWRKGRFLVFLGENQSIPNPNNHKLTFRDCTHSWIYWFFKHPFGDHTKWLAAGNLVGIPLAPLCFFLFRQNSASFPGHSTFTKWDPSSESKKDSKYDSYAKHMLIKFIFPYQIMQAHLAKNRLYPLHCENNHIWMKMLTQQMRVVPFYG